VKTIAEQEPVAFVLVSSCVVVSPVVALWLSLWCFVVLSFCRFEGFVKPFDALAHGENIREMLGTS
jgi:hypothetical protein